MPDADHRDEHQATEEAHQRDAERAACGASARGPAEHGRGQRGSCTTTIANASATPQRGVDAAPEPEPEDHDRRDDAPPSSRGRRAMRRLDALGRRRRCRRSSIAPLGHRGCRVGVALAAPRPRLARVVLGHAALRSGSTPTRTSRSTPKRGEHEKKSGPVPRRRRASAPSRPKTTGTATMAMAWLERVVLGCVGMAIAAAAVVHRRFPTPSRPAGRTRRACEHVSRAGRSTTRTSSPSGAARVSPATRRDRRRPPARLEIDDLGAGVASGSRPPRPRLAPGSSVGSSSAASARPRPRVGPPHARVEVGEEEERQARRARSAPARCPGSCRSGSSAAAESKRRPQPQDRRPNAAARGRAA